MLMPGTSDRHPHPSRCECRPLPPAGEAVMTCNTILQLPGCSTNRILMSKEQLPILIADDQRGVLEALRLLLKSEDHACHAVGDPTAALAAVKKTLFSAALIDLN